MVADAEAATHDPAGRPLQALPQVPKADPAAPGAWTPDPTQGLRITCLAYDTVGIPAAAQCGADLVLGWDAQGLCLHAVVQALDLTPGADPERLYLGTSLECFLRTGAAWHNLVQVVVSPGPDPGNGTLQTQFFDYRGPLSAAHEPTLSCTLQVARSASGYDLQLRLPWRLIGLRPVVGAVCECKITVNWHSVTALRIQGTWRGPGGEDFHRLQLAGPEARPPALVRAAWLALEAYQTVMLCALGPLSDAGRVLTIRTQGQAHGAALATITLAAADGRSQGSCTLPVTALRTAAPVQIAGVDGLVATCHLPDFRADLRARVDHALQHPPWDRAFPALVRAAHGVHGDFLFTGADFPQLQIASAEVRAALAITCERVVFIDHRGRAVAQAAAPGRYGVVFTLSYAGPLPGAGDPGPAPRCTRLAYHTLLRLPDAPAALRELTVRAAALRAAVRHHQGGERSTDAPGTEVLAATDPDTASYAAVAWEGLSHASGVWAQERAWWHAVRRDLGLLTAYGRLVTVPHLYQRLPTHRWPALVILHGSGDPYAPLTERTPEVIQRHAESVPDNPFVVLGLQSMGWWESGQVADALARACADFHLDPHRLILIGFSMGGYGTWQTLIDYPTLFAAGEPISAGPGEPWAAGVLARLPIWCWSGAQDRTTTAAHSEQMLSAIRDAGGAPLHTVLPGCDHMQVPGACAASPAWWAWLEKQRRPPLVPPPAGDGKAGP